MKISTKKREKIAEQILASLYHASPKPVFISHISSEIARDQEFVKELLLELKKKKLVIDIDKNPQGIKYLKRTRWKLSDTVYQVYSNNQLNSL
jgi:hypothetical protein